MQVQQALLHLKPAISLQALQVRGIICRLVAAMFSTMLRCFGISHRYVDHFDCCDLVLGDEMVRHCAKTG